jgi:hypothetical protein
MRLRNCTKYAALTPNIPFKKLKGQAHNETLKKGLEKANKRKQFFSQNIRYQTINILRKKNTEVYLLYLKM